MGEPEKPAITATAAQLFVSDIRAACDFFVHQLGFAMAFTYGDPPFYAQVRRDRGLFNLRHADSAVIYAARRDRESLLSADLGLDTRRDIELLYAEFAANGVTFFETLRQQPWGALNFIVKDPDGNLLLFAGPAA